MGTFTDSDAKQIDIKTSTTPPKETGYLTYKATDADGNETNKEASTTDPAILKNLRSIMEAWIDGKNVNFEFTIDDTTGVLSSLNIRNVTKP